MTTRVIIKSPEKNHQDILVTILSTSITRDRLPLPHAIRITDGQEVEFNVYGSQSLLIEEVEKEV